MSISESRLQAGSAVEVSTPKVVVVMSMMMAETKQLEPGRTLSVRQPWATLLVTGVKLTENRSWPTRMRGPLLIHAAGRVDTSSAWADEFEFLPTSAMSGRSH